MRQDKTFARILLIFSVANLALAAPAVVRQRHLDVAKAASEKRTQGSDIESTGTFGTGASGMPPNEHYEDMWKWANSDQPAPLPPGSPGSAPAPAPANRIITTQAPRPAAPAGNRYVPVSPESSFHSSANWPDPSPPRHLLAKPGLDEFIDKHPGVTYMGVVGILGSAVAFGYALNQGVKQMYVSPLSPPSPADI